MRVPRQKLLGALVSARALAHDYELTQFGENPDQKFVNKLLETCGQVIALPFKIFRIDEVDGTESPVKGASVFYDDRVDILLAGNLNECWERFVLTKELMHAAIDVDEYHNMNIEEQVDEFQLAIADDDSKPNLPVIAEFLAEVAAMEFLFPYAKRVYIRAANAELDFFAIAKRFMLPRIMVELYLSPRFMTYLGELEDVFNSAPDR